MPTTSRVPLSSVRRRCTAWPRPTRHSHTLDSVSYTHLNLDGRHRSGILLPEAELAVDRHGVFERVPHEVRPVSYTHLDVYKRQGRGGVGFVNDAADGNGRIQERLAEDFTHAAGLL